MTTVTNPQIATVRGAPIPAATRPKGKLPIGSRPRLIKPKRGIIRPRLVSALWSCSKVAIGSIDDRSAQRRKDNPRKAEAEPLKSQIKRRVDELKNKPALGGGLDQCSPVPEKKTTPVARPSVRSDGPRPDGKRVVRLGETEKSERNLDYLQVSYRRDMIAVVLVIATVFEFSAKKHQMATVCQFCCYVFVAAVIESRRPLAFPRTRHSSIL
jgi:hypothetical protein